MKLTEPQQQYFRDYLNKAWQNRSCEVCGTNIWVINQPIVESPEFYSGNIKPSIPESIPFVVVTCDNCGNTKFFSAVKYGFVTK